MEIQNTTNSPQPGQAGTKRIEYIDALRGFTMFLVVVCHVSLFCFGVFGRGYTYVTFVLQMVMPLFFFISGFVMYKADMKWNVGQIVKFFKKKTPVLLITPFIFFAIYVFSFNKSMMQGLFDVGKFGYWFTYVLFVYYVIYVTVMSICRKWWADILLVVIGLCIYVVIWPGYRDHIPVSGDILSLLSVDRWHHFIFFVLGTLTKKHYEKVVQLLEGKWFVMVCLLFYFLSNIFKWGDVIPQFLNFWLLSFTGIVIVFTFFRKNQAVFSKEHRLGRAMQFVGRRTLDIYLIHYFFLPENLTFVTVFKDHPMPVLEFLASSTVAIIVIVASLLVSNIIRLSPFLAHWLFGAKQVSN